MKKVFILVLGILLVTTFSYAGKAKKHSKTEYKVTTQKTKIVSLRDAKNQLEAALRDIVRTQALMDEQIDIRDTLIQDIKDAEKAGVVEKVEL